MHITLLATMIVALAPAPLPKLKSPHITKEDVQGRKVMWTGGVPHRVLFTPDGRFWWEWEYMINGTPIGFNYYAGHWHLEANTLVMRYRYYRHVPLGVLWQDDAVIIWRQRIIRGSKDELIEESGDPFKLLYK